MNFQGGMRRLAIFLGVLGALAGGFHAYRVLRNVPSERYQHKVFEDMAASDVVKQDEAILRSSKLAGSADCWPLFTSVDGARGVPPCLDVDLIQHATSANVSDVPSDAYSSRIRTIYWNRDLSVDFFEMEDGGIVDSGPSPSAWKYLLWVVFPAVGFVIAWGVVRAIMWVSAGFFEAT